MRTITAQQHAERMALYNQGLTDEEIARQLSCGKAAIVMWRAKNKLPGRDSWVGVPMEQALTPNECEAMRGFLRTLIAAADHGKVDVGRTMSYWRLNGLAKGAA